MWTETERGAGGADAAPDRGSVLGLIPIYLRPGAPGVPVLPESMLAHCVPSQSAPSRLLRTVSQGA